MLPVRRSNFERNYVVAYDISDAKRWRKIFRTMKGYGRWSQLSVFHCRLNGRRRAEMAMALETMISPGEDHILILDLGIDLGPADDTALAVESWGKSFTPIERRPIVI